MKINLSRLKHKTATVGQGLAILSWVTFIVSFFQPVHMIIAQPMMYGWQFAMTFWGDMIFLPLLLILNFDFDFLVYLAFAAVYNLGNVLLFLAPLLPGKLPDKVMRKIHLGTVSVCTLAAVAYKYVDDIQLGYSHFSGYDTWVLAYCLLLLASFLMLNKETRSQEKD